MNKILFVSTAASLCLFVFAGFASFANAALPLENCADYLRVSFNQQAVFSSNDFNPGSPSTVKIAGKAGPYFWFEEGMNGSSQFDVVVYEERGYMQPGEIVFKQYGENTWFSKDEDEIVYYDCSIDGGGKTDDFSFYIGKNYVFELANGNSFTADYLRVKAKRADVFRLRDDYLGGEFYVLTTRVFESGIDYGAGSVFFASPSQPGKFEEYYSYATGKQYARIPYVSCCAARLTTLAPSATPAPTAPSPQPTAPPAPSPAPTARRPAASPSPEASIAEKPVRDFNAQSNGLLTALVFVVVFAAFVIAVYFLFKGRTPEPKKPSEVSERGKKRAR